MLGRLEEYSKYAEVAVRGWSLQEEEAIRQEPVLLPTYGRLRQLLNQSMLRVAKTIPKITGKSFTDSGNRLVTWAAAREWRAVMLPGYGEMLPSGRQLSWIRQQVNLYWQRFAHFERELGGLGASVRERAVRLLWFGAYRVAVNGGQMPKQLEALFAYACLYPLVDDVFDDPMLSHHAKAAMVKELMAELEGKPHTGNAYPRSPLFDRCANQVKGAMGGLPPGGAIEMRECLELLAFMEADETGPGDLLSKTCLKGSLALLPIYLLENKTIDYAQVFCLGLSMQLVDDLQDAMADLHSSAPNVFSQALRSGQSPTGLITRTLNYVTAQDYHRNDALAAFVEASLLRMLTYLLTEASFLHGAALGPEYLRTLHRHLPFPLSLVSHYPLEAKLYRLVEILTDTNP